MADYWKYKGRFIEKYGDKGISLVVANNDKGFELITESEKYLEFEKTEEQTAIKSCRHLCHHPQESRFRKKFFELLLSDGYYTAFKKYNLKAKIEYAIKKLF